MIPSKIDIYTQKKYLEDVSFSTLMRKRIYNVLLVSSVYDAFMLEEDGRIDEQIFYEYMSLNLRFPPRFLNATSKEEAFNVLEEESIDLVITMLSGEEKNTFQLADEIKSKYPEVYPVEQWMDPKVMEKVNLWSDSVKRKDRAEGFDS